MVTLLLVDADHNFRETLAIALRLDGIVVRSLAGADEALPVVDNLTYDFALVDCLLPGADRLVARLVRDGRTRVIATSAHGEVIGEALRRHPGLVTLPKPFRTHELLRCLSEYESGPRKTALAG